MNELLEDQDLQDHIVFIGQTLAPFYLEDPLKGTAGPAFEAMRSLDIAHASQDWPFVEEEDTLVFLSLMQEGLSDGIDSESLVWEYRRLFIGPNIKPAPPWGSVYTDKDCVVFGQSALELSAWMRQQGIERLQDEKTPSDHIGLMLSLMAWITANKPKCLEEYLGLHLFTWSSHFLDLLADAAEQPFYQGLAYITKASLEGIQRRLNIAVEYPRYYR